MQRNNVKQQRSEENVLSQRGGACGFEDNWKWRHCNEVLLCMEAQTRKREYLAFCFLFLQLILGAGPTNFFFQREGWDRLSWKLKKKTTKQNQTIKSNKVTNKQTKNKRLRVARGLQLFWQLNPKSHKHGKGHWVDLLASGLSSSVGTWLRN